MACKKREEASTVRGARTRERSLAMTGGLSSDKSADKEELDRSVLMSMCGTTTTTSQEELSER